MNCNRDRRREISLGATPDIFSASTVHSPTSLSETIEGLTTNGIPLAVRPELRSQGSENSNVKLTFTVH